ncbi:Mannonate dehydratase [Serratia fonticola]|uniref:Mannonate dehydratase n=1 Tax=Serratia fonticola TaxID=47917 RepID=A0A4V6KR05_SERFO|nr:Mannonate dehydratase [Serratia fonticola]
MWPVEQIKARQALLAEKGLVWSVVESIPVHEEIKTHSGNYQRHIANYQQSLRNLAECGIDTVCYNFMPILDWTRTDLEYQLPDGSKALRFDQIAFAAFDLHILCRSGAEKDYTDEEQAQAQRYFKAMSTADIAKLTGNIIAGLPGAEEGYTLDQFRARLAEYDHINKAQLRENMAVFLRAIVPVAEEVGVRLAVHPDDPPRPILGLPRIVSTIEDMQWLKETVDSIYNGFTMCTGSYGVRADNDLVRMIETFGDRIHFTHLRATCREQNPKTFHEGAHLQGDVDMVAVVEAILTEEQRRHKAGDLRPIPMRPDHGHQMPGRSEEENQSGLFGHRSVERFGGGSGGRVGVEAAVFPGITLAKQGALRLRPHR